MILLLALVEGGRGRFLAIVMSDEGVEAVDGHFAICRHHPEPLLPGLDLGIRDPHRSGQSSGCWIGGSQEGQGSAPFGFGRPAREREREKVERNRGRWGDSLRSSHEEDNPSVCLLRRF